MSLFIENGLADSDSGADGLVTNELIVTGTIHWVSSVTGNDSNSGNESDPLATIGQAITNATANNGDVIMVKSGHSQTITSSITVSKAGLKIFGVGSGSDKPQITVNAAIDGINITADDVEINNIGFPAGTTATNTARINVGADNARIKNCTFTCGAYDASSITIPAAGTNCEIDSCSFSVSADGPDHGIIVESASATGLKVSNCSFSGGSYNWDLAAVYSNVAHLNFVYDSNTLTNDATILHAASAKGILSNTIAGEGSLVQA